MREILFRGKRVDNGKWVEGSAVWFDEDQCFIMPPYPGASSMSYARLFALTAVMVDPATINQYTGLTDMNGVKIFEGDIVDMTGQWWDAACPAGHNSPVVQVKWRDCFCGFTPFANYDCDCGVYIKANGCKVIGNIHDNPELLEGENNDITKGS